MRARPSGLAAIASPALAATLAAAGLLGASGCGGVSGAASSPGDQLTVYSSLPLKGADEAISKQLVDGEKLALDEAGGQAGRFQVQYTSLDDSSVSSGRWDPGVTASNAKIAAQDQSTIAYLGDYDSGATAISLPLINAAGIAQISPASPYGGLTSSLDAGQDEPERFYPSGKRNFARLQPGDAKQALAQTQLIKSLDVKRLYVLDDENPFESPLAQMLISDAEQAGITVVAHDSLDTKGASGFAGEVAKVAASGAEAMLFAGSAGPGPAALFEALHAAAPRLWLLGPSTLADPAFTSELRGASARRTLLTTPVLPLRLYPRSARRVLTAYRRRFGGAPGAYALFGYEAMSYVLDAIRRAGARGNDRQAVISELVSQRPHDSVIGRYAIEADGETTLQSYAVDRVSAGKPVFWRALALR